MAGDFIASVGAAVAGACFDAAAVGGGALVAVVPDTVGVTAAPGVVTATVEITVAEATAGVVSPSGILSVHAPEIRRIKMDRKNGIRFMSVHPIC